MRSIVMAGSRRGAALIFVFIIAAAITVIVGVFLYMVTVEQRSMRSSAARHKAYWLAAAGIEQALYKIRNDVPSGYRANPVNIATTTLGDGTYSVVVSKSGNAYTIASTGTVAGETRTITSIWRDSLFRWAAFAGGSGMTISVNMSGQAITDSYDSTKGAYNEILADGSVNRGLEGDVGTNADISTSGQAYIGGDAYTGPLGTYSDQGSVAGSITHSSEVTLPPVAVPSLPWSSLPAIEKNKTNIISAGDYTAPTINLDSQTELRVNGPSNIYLTGMTSISVTGQAQITVGSGGPVKIFSDGAVSIAGGGVVNTSGLPANFQIYGTQSCTSISYTGQAAYYGAIYAPVANVSLAGQGGVYGAFISDTTTISGQGGIHYDTDLMNLASQTTFASLKKQDYHEQ